MGRNAKKPSSLVFISGDFTLLRKWRLLLRELKLLVKPVWPLERPFLVLVLLVLELQELLLLELLVPLLLELLVPSEPPPEVLELLLPVLDSVEESPLESELNDRFAAYIERVRFLEADNKRLQSIITELTLKFESLDAALRAIYEEELKQARKTIDKTTAAKGAAELRAYNAEAKLKEVTALYTAESAAHVVTKESIPQLEKMISERDSQIDYLTKNVAAIKLELKRLKGQSSSLQSDP